MTSRPDSATDLGGHLGLELLEASAEGAVVRLAVRPAHLQPYGLVHGGVYCAMVEHAASIAAACWMGERGRVVGVCNQTDFLRGVRQGTVTATASPIHRGRLQQLWAVEIRDEEGRLVARGQVRIQNLETAERPGGA